MWANGIQTGGLQERRNRPAWLLQLGPINGRVFAPRANKFRERCVGTHRSHGLDRGARVARQRPAGALVSPAFDLLYFAATRRGSQPARRIYAHCTHLVRARGKNDACVFSLPSAHVLSWVYNESAAILVQLSSW
ncbi:hypothetical protein MRX96_041556 [Rhipicephalus microplus]